MFLAKLLIFGIAFGIPVAAFIVTFTYIAFHPDFDGKPRYECCECGAEVRSLSTGHRCYDCEFSEEVVPVNRSNNDRRIAA